MLSSSPTTCYLCENACSKAREGLGAARDDAELTMAPLFKKDAARAIVLDHGARPVRGQRDDQGGLAALVSALGQCIGRPKLRS
jgi:hypothetical protein